MAVLCAAPAFGAFAFERTSLHQYEDGPQLPASHIFLPGEPVYFAGRLSGYQAASDPTTETRNVKLSWHFEVSDPQGVMLEAPAAGAIAEPLASQDKNWLPKFLHQFVVPPFAPPGVYHIKVKASDEVAKSEILAQLDFQVRGHPVEPSETLTARNLYFLKTEQDGPPLNPALFKPGETLWARFDITGYGFSEKNQFSVAYGLAVLRESGQQVFAQPAAASDSKSSFYPQRYVPGAVSLNLNSDVPAGTYILVITMEDKITGQMAETRGQFQVER